MQQNQVNFAKWLKHFCNSKQAAMNLSNFQNNSFKSF